jgi:hypothetical protein
MDFLQFVKIRFIGRRHRRVAGSAVHAVIHASCAVEHASGAGFDFVRVLDQASVAYHRVDGKSRPPYGNAQSMHPINWPGPC